MTCAQAHTHAHMYKCGSYRPNDCDSTCPNGKVCSAMGRCDAAPAGDGACCTYPLCFSYVISVYTREYYYIHTLC